MRDFPRLLTSEERVLIAYLWGGARFSDALPRDFLVEEMDDGGMGSLSFVSTKGNRIFGETAATCTFKDRDGIEVVASLILDQDGDLYQLDMWKTNFDPLIQIPEVSAFSPHEERPKA